MKIWLVNPNESDEELQYKEIVFSRSERNNCRAYCIYYNSLNELPIFEDGSLSSWETQKELL